jgi:predicted ABC-type transport system involved in lysophospholipase L1 biosynthesis ATPase subunit
MGAAVSTSGQSDAALLPVVAALEALEAGDVRLATAILLGAVETGETVARCRCQFCGDVFEWPGLLDHHVRFVHPDLPEEEFHPEDYLPEEELLRKDFLEDVA